MVALTVAPILGAVANRTEENEINGPSSMPGIDSVTINGPPYPPDGTYAGPLPTAERGGLLQGAQAPTADRSQIPDVQAPTASRRHLDYAQIYDEDEVPTGYGYQPGRGGIFSSLIQGIAPSLTQAQRERYGVSEQDATVAGQMEQLMAEGSPYMTQARTGAKQEAAARGLLNTSMAAGAGELAAIQSALPIAQQDAAAHMELMLQKMSQNTQLSLADQETAANFLLQKQQIGAQLSLADLEVASNLLTQKIQAETQLSVADLDAATRLMGIELDNQNKLALQQMIEDNKLRIQHDASVSTAFSNTMNSIAQMYQNDKIPWNVQNEIAEDFIDSFASYVEFQDLTGDSNYADAFDWGKWDTRPTPEDEEALEQAEREREAATEDRETYPPFGKGGFDGEQRITGGYIYTWVESRQQWKQGKRVSTQSGRDW